MFLSACLGRVQLTRYKGRQKHKAKIGKLTKKLQFLGDFIFFAKCLARAQISSLTSKGFFIEVLSVTILETTKTKLEEIYFRVTFYRSQFWRLQKRNRKDA